MPFRDVATVCGGETLAERYKQTIARLDRVVTAGYAIKLQWKCEFEPTDDGWGVPEKPLCGRWTRCTEGTPRPFGYITG
jgi:hypothetical protein